MPRLNKYLALCGLGSRRKVENLVTEGRVKVNGKTTKDLATLVDAEADTVMVDGNRVTPEAEFKYIILNKPRGYITTLSDDRGRSTVMDLLPEKYIRAGVFPVGRLDRDTEGLLLFTNDGELANMLARPAFKVEKVYIAELDRKLLDEDKKKIEKGIYIHQTKTKTRPATVELIEKSDKLVKVKIHEGKKRQIRYTFLNVGYKVVKLKRISYGPLSIHGLFRGETRPLKSGEIRSLKRAVKGE